MSVHKKLHEASERQEHSERGNRLVSLAAAIIAVLAALATLLTHHRSISALTEKNRAILLQSRAADTYNKYEAKRVRINVTQALLDSDVVSNATMRNKMTSFTKDEDGDAQLDLKKAQQLEHEADASEEHSEKLLKSYETLEIATTFFEISIVLVSIATLARTRVFLTAGCVVSAIGIVLLVVGYWQGY